LKFGRRASVLWLLVGFVPTAQAEDATNAPAKPAAKTEPAPSDVDDEFLEFLGSVDSEEADRDWLEYLVRTDLSKVAKAKPKAADATEVKK
jgi:hypothetical protein